VAAQRTDEDPMVRPVADGWASTPIWTVGETVKGDTPPGIPDGMSVHPARGRGVMSAFVNHELRSEQGYAYTLANGTSLTGARISRFDIQMANLRVIDAELAYDTAHGVDGDEVTAPSQVGGGIGRLCSGRGVSAGELGFVDEIHFAGEEQDDGVLYALDIVGRELWALPDAGLVARENVSPVDTGTDSHTALLIGDDREGASLWLYVGEKRPAGSFLERNGLTGGTLYAWVADANRPVGTFDSPAEFSGTGTQASGSWVAVEVRDGSGNLRSTGDLDTDAAHHGAFEFSRPEDVRENPADRQQLVLGSTGRETWDGASDVYGTTYLVDIAFAGGVPTRADLTILSDSAEALATAGIDDMLRSPDNLTWAGDGKVYVQEDRAVDPWGTVEASIWQLDPATPGAAVRIAQVDRTAVPAGQVDLEAGAPKVGTWETSGIVDVSHLRKGNDLALLYNVEAHSVRGGPIDELGLVQGGQIGLLTFDG
jgi:glycerophosphoryl diester phosphodiesterase